jgi:hypothetical protein
MEFMLPSLADATLGLFFPLLKNTRNAKTFQMKISIILELMNFSSQSFFHARQASINDDDIYAE